MCCKVDPANPQGKRVGVVSAGLSATFSLLNNHERIDLSNSESLTGDFMVDENGEPSFHVETESSRYCTDLKVSGWRSSEAR